MATLKIGLDTSRIASKLDVISRHAAACAAELRVLDADEVELLTARAHVDADDVADAASALKRIPPSTLPDYGTPLFDAVWDAIKGWDLQRRPGEGYANATGDDVQAIVDAIRPVVDKGAVTVDG